MDNRFDKSVEGIPHYLEQVSVTTDDTFKEQALAGRVCIDIDVVSQYNSIYATVTIENAKQLAQHLLDAVEFLENS